MTHAGEVTIEVPYGQDRQTGEWFSPVRIAWGLRPHQRLSPELEQRLCLTAAATFSYERAAEVVACWGGPPVDDSRIHRHVQKAGERAREEEKRREREAQIPALREETVRQAGKEHPRGSFSLIIMMDGWMARERGTDWGLKPPEKKAGRVAWREMKTAIIMRVEDRAETASGRPMVIGKAIVAHQGEWDGLAKKLYAEALRRGLMQAKEVFVVADGGGWIWNLKEERFAHATGVLDFYHASEHVWDMGRALYGQDGGKTDKWVIRLLRQLRHGAEKKALKRMEATKRNIPASLEEEARKTIGRTVNYFHTHSDRLHYADVEERGCPVGSGAMESTCAQLQSRLKRTGQFWTEEGKANLLSLELARRNGDWSRVWENKVALN